VVLHPYIGGGLLVEYFGHRRFDPARNAPVLSVDSGYELDAPMTRDERLRYQSRLDELSQIHSAIEPLNEGKIEEKAKEVKAWERLQAAATPGIDTSGRPVLQLRAGDALAQVGVSRANILIVSDSSELAAELLQARIRQELRPATARKTSPSEVERDLTLFQHLLSLQPREAGVAPSSAPATAALQ